MSTGGGLKPGLTSPTVSGNAEGGAFSGLKSAAIRSDFAILARSVRDGKPSMYLDSGATSHKPRQVLDAERGFYEQRNFVVHRGTRQLFEAATDAFGSARKTAAHFIGAQTWEVVFTKNATQAVNTEAINLVAYAFSYAAPSHRFEAGVPAVAQALDLASPCGYLIGVHPHDVGQTLDDAGVVVQSGHHCAWPLHQRLDVSVTTRASFGGYNTGADVEASLSAPNQVAALFGLMALGSVAQERGSLSVQEEKRYSMTYVIALPCVDVKDKACIEECPVDCIYVGDRMLYIQPDECIDCGACEPVCPVEAIFYEDDVPEVWADYYGVNVDFFAEVGSPGGAAKIGEIPGDHPLVAALPPQIH